jgi:hypothetical protein
MAKAVNGATGIGAGIRTQPPTAMPTPSGGEAKFEINYNPTVYVDGGKPGDLEEKLKRNNEKLLQMFRDFLRQQYENERRMSYA